MDSSWVLSLPAGVTVAPAADGELLVLAPACKWVLRQLPAPLRAALCRLTAPGDAAGRLAETVRTGGPDALARWYYHLHGLTQRRLLHLSAADAGAPLATLVPTAPGFALTPTAPLSGRPHVLSRFAYSRRDGEALVMESPLACARLILHDPRAAAVVYALAQPRTVKDLAAAVPHLAPDAVAPLLGLLVKAGVACEKGDNGTTAEDAEPSLRCWEFHDLLFHARSREGRHDAVVGATYPLAGRVAALPALQAVPPAAECIDLYRPDLERLKREDPPFAQVQEGRRSVRDYAAEPLTDHQLGEFLYRVARVKEVQVTEVSTADGPKRQEFALRPYPAGGALYELEVYAVVRACRGLPAGLFRYDPLGHRLVRIAGLNADVERLLADAGLASGIAPARLQVLLILTARLPRVAWKYASLAYALVLKHVGVVYQTMYLAATAMGLAPCALGCGNSDQFARAAGVDYYAETSVGEFLLASVGA